MPRSLLDDPAFASIGRARAATAGHRPDRAKVVLAVGLLLAAGGFYAWNAGLGRGPEPVQLTPDEADAFAANTALGEEMRRQPGTIEGSN